MNSALPTVRQIAADSAYAQEHQIVAKRVVGRHANLIDTALYELAAKIAAEHGVTVRRVWPDRIVFAWTDGDRALWFDGCRWLEAA